MSTLWVMLAAAALFVLFGLVAVYCGCRGRHDCGSCPLKEKNDESNEESP